MIYWSLSMDLLWQGMSSFLQRHSFKCFISLLSWENCGFFSTHIRVNNTWTNYFLIYTHRKHKVMLHILPLASKNLAHKILCMRNILIPVIKEIVRWKLLLINYFGIKISIMAKSMERFLFLFVGSVCPFSAGRWPVVTSGSFQVSPVVPGAWSVQGQFRVCHLFSTLTTTVVS